MTAPGLPPSGRAVQRAVTAAVAATAATAAADAAALADAAEQLLACDRTQVRDVLHTLTLDLVEKAFPDGLDADDLRALLAEVTRAAVPWLPGLDPHAVVLVLTGALSVHEPDAPAVEAAALSVACALIVDHLLGQLDLRLDDALADAFGTLRTAQTMESP